MSGVPGGDEAWPVTIAGDPTSLRIASQKYTWAAQLMSQAAGRLRGSLGDLASWEGQGAKAHAVRAQGLAAAQQVGGQSLSYGATALGNYASQLEEAQGVAAQANLAHEQADQLALQVRQAEAALADAERAAAAAQANRYASSAGHPGQSVSTPPTSQSQFAIDDARQASARLAYLQQELSAQTAQASALAAHARAMARAAAAQAAAAFDEVAALAGNPALHTNADPFVAYLGAARPGMAASMVQASYNLGGDPDMVSGLNAKGKPTLTLGGDTKALADLAADPTAGTDNRRLAGVYIKTNDLYTRVLQKERHKLYADHISDDQLPGWVGHLSPVTEAALLYRLIKRIPSGFWVDALREVGNYASWLAVGLTAISLAQGGVDIFTDTDAGLADGATAGADAVIRQGVKKALEDAFKAAKLNKWAVYSSGLAFGADAGADTITGEWGSSQITQLALDSLTLLPGLGAWRADVSLARTVQDFADEEAKLEGLARDSEEYSDLKSTLADLKAAYNSRLIIAKLDAAISLAGGTGGSTLGFATLGIEWNNLNGGRATSRAPGRRGPTAPRPRGSSAPAKPGP